MGFHDEPNENHEEDGENSFQADPNDPVEIKRREDFVKERMRNYLIQQKGFEEDELDTLFPTFQELQTFYNEARAADGLINANDKEFDTPGKKIAQDDKSVTLSETDKRRVKELRKARRLYAKRLKELKAMMVSQEIDTETKDGQELAKQQFDDANADSGLPPQKQLSYEDFMKSIGVDDIDKLLNDMD